MKQTPRQQLIEMAASRMAKVSRQGGPHESRRAHECVEGVVEQMGGEIAAYYSGISQTALERLISAVVARSKALRKVRPAAEATGVTLAEAVEAGREPVACASYADMVAAVESGAADVVIVEPAGRYIWDRLTMGDVPMDGDTIIMPDGEWTLKHNMSPLGWGLRKGGAAHPVLGVYQGMADLMTAIWSYGHRVADTETHAAKRTRPEPVKVESPATCWQCAAFPSFLDTCPVCSAAAPLLPPVDEQGNDEIPPPERRATPFPYNPADFRGGPLPPHPTVLSQTTERGVHLVVMARLWRSPSGYELVTVDGATWPDGRRKDKLGREERAIIGRLTVDALFDYKAALVAAGWRRMQDGPAFWLAPAPTTTPSNGAIAIPAHLTDDQDVQRYARLLRNALLVAQERHDQAQLPAPECPED